ncbi:MAG: hypothetical protein Q4B26_02240 [Eubacteriales bacterium]|nr:hypothetical protein [Eubacteriales bacterium]
MFLDKRNKKYQIVFLQFFLLFFVCFQSGCSSVSNRAVKKNAEQALTILSGIDPANLDYEISVIQSTDILYKKENAFRNYRNTIYVASENDTRRYLDGAYGILFEDNGGKVKQTNHYYWYQLEISFDDVSREAFQTMLDALKGKSWNECSIEDSETAEGETVKTVTLNWKTSVQDTTGAEPLSESVASTLSDTGTDESIVEQSITYDDNGDFVYDEVEHVDPLKNMQLAAVAFVISEKEHACGAFQISYVGDNGKQVTVLWNDTASVAQSYREELWHKGENAPSLEEKEAEVREEMQTMGISYISKAKE